ncbi:MAG: hypothetical protein PW734_04645 [Verrucomicrobium sp.]|nr:hypothetical protein [Verrucomicrobium sp.]
MPSTPEAARAALAKRDSLRGFPSRRAQRRAEWESRSYDRRGISITD